MRDDWILKGLSDAIRKTLGREPRVGCEVGIWRGQLSRRLLREFPSLYLFMIDPYTPYEDKLGHLPVDDRMDAMKEAVAETMFAANQRRFWLMSSMQSQVFFPDGYFDFVYIDADHSEEAVAADFNLWHPKVREGGLLGGHDYNGVGDKRGHFGVKKAVDKATGLLGLEVPVRKEHL